MGRGINGGDPRFAGRSPFMPRKPVAPRLISEHGVVNFHASVIPPSYLLSDFSSGAWIGHRNKCSSAGILSAPEQWHHQDALQIASLATRLRQRVAATHPSLRPDTRQPIGHGRHDAAAVLLYVPLRDVSYGHDPSITIDDRLSEQALAFENTQAVVP